MTTIDELGLELGKKKLPNVHVGDTVQVHYLIREGQKERIQLFTGTVLVLQGRGIAKAIVVRRIVQGEGVERTFPLHSPRVTDVTVTRRGKVRQARLYYLRDRVGKKTRVTELVGEKVRREREAAKADAAAEASDASAAAAAEEAATADSGAEPEAVDA